MNTLYKYIFSFSFLELVTIAMVVMILLQLSYMNGFLNGACPSTDKQHQAIDEVDDEFNSRETRKTTKGEAVQQPNIDMVSFNPHSGIAAISPEIAEVNSGLEPKIPENIPETNPAMAGLDSGIFTENPAIFTELPLNRPLNPNSTTEQLQVNIFGDGLVTQHKDISCSAFHIRECALYED
ncbi:hypothetical protein [Shewanella donghaensis]|uniref:hypothetical protein n=1 Tax=Shewanella donghaensis TaxID=238836 RepID=UPI0011845F14|nr:hypothetical protein [Shewanella donghaensis]